MPAYNKAVEVDSPIAYWPMEDASGELLPAKGTEKVKLTNGPTYRQTGAVKGGLGAVSFDGTNDYGQVALDLSAQVTFTVEFWLYWDTNGTDDDFAMEHGANANSLPGFNFDWNNSTGGAETNEVSIKVQQTIGLGRWSFPRPTAKAWHHIVAVVSNTKPIVYIDGTSVTVTQREEPNMTTGNFTNTTLNLFSRNGAALFGKGKMEQLAFYAGTLSKARVEAHFKASSEEEGGGPKAYEANVTETLSTSDALVRAVTTKRSISDSLSLSDATKRSTGVTRKPSESITTSENVTSKESYPRSIAESTSTSDSVKRSTTAVRGIAQPLTTSDAVSRSTIDTRKVSESLTTSDTPGYSFPTVMRSVAETLTTSDSVKRVVIAVRKVTESLSITDAVTRVTGSSRSVNESIITSESPKRIGTFARSIAQVLTTIDTVTRISGPSRKVSDSVSTSDNPVRQLSTVRKDSTTLTTNDSVKATKTNLRSVFEILATSDIAIHSGGALSRIVNEILSTVTAVARSFQGHRDIEDTVTGVDFTHLSFVSIYHGDKIVELFLDEPRFTVSGKDLVELTEIKPISQVAEIDEKEIIVNMIHDSLTVNKPNLDLRLREITDTRLAQTDYDDKLVINVDET